MSRLGSPSQRRDRLAHIRWVGGSPCAGKSSIVDWLAARTPLHIYRCDDRAGPHMARASKQAQPHMHRISTMSWEAIWMRPVGVLLADEIAFYREEWPMIVEDLIRLPPHRPVVAEGAALLPALVHGVLGDSCRAVWVVPTEAFQRAHYRERRGLIEGALDGCSDPERAFENWMARDAAMGRWVRAEAVRLGLPVLTVDGAQPLDRVAAAAAARLGLAVRRE